MCETIFEGNMSSRYPPEYKVENNCLYMEQCTKQGKQTKKLCNFTPYVISEITQDDGVSETKKLLLGGEHENGRQLKEIEVDGNDLATFNWLMNAWGVDCILEIGSNIKDYIRYAIQSTAKFATKQTTYAITGWKKIEGKWKYLMPGLADTNVSLSGKLDRYEFIEEYTEKDIAKAFHLISYDVAPKEIIYTLMAFTFMSPLNEFLHRANCEPKFVLFLLGKTGTRKSTLSALFLSFFGKFTSSDLPLSFRDTANSITHHAFTLKDVLTCIDDFHPCGKQEETKLTATAQSIMRSYGDRTGRGRLKSDATPMDSRPPQGNAIITAEYSPDIGESGTARYFGLGLKSGDVNLSMLSMLQKEASEGILQKTMYAYTKMISNFANADEKKFVGSLAESFRIYRNEFNKQNIQCHGRVPEIVANLRIGMKMFLLFMKEHKVIDDEACSNIESEFFEILCVLAKRQSENIEQDKPTHKFIRKLYALIDSDSAVIINRNFESNVIPNNLIGYEDDDYYYLNKTAAHRAVKKLCDEQGESFTITEKGLLKALAEEKLIDTAEGQNTKSVRIGGKTKRVVCLIKSKSDPIADTT